MGCCAGGAASNDQGRAAGGGASAPQIPAVSTKQNIEAAKIAEAPKKSIERPAAVSEKPKVVEPVKAPVMEVKKEE